jgi:hypothetical protein
MTPGLNLKKVDADKAEDRRQCQGPVHSTQTLGEVTRLVHQHEKCKNSKPSQEL